MLLGALQPLLDAVAAVRLADAVAALGRRTGGLTMPRMWPEEERTKRFSAGTKLQMRKHWRQGAMWSSSAETA
jgi:hypothetical protein